MDRDYDPDIIADLAQLLGISSEEAATTLDRAMTDQAILAIEAIDAEDAPELLRGVALVANHALAAVARDIAARITAIQRMTWTTFEPGEPVPDRFAWQMDRLSNRPHVPGVTVEHEGWGYRCVGNTVHLEAWLREHGYPRARALGATSCALDCDRHDHQEDNR